MILLLLAFVQWYRSRSASTTEESRSGQAAPYDESSVHSMTPSMIEELRSVSSSSPSATTSAASSSSRFSLPAPLTRWLGLASPPSDYKQVSGTTTNRLFSIEEEDGKRDEEVEVEL